MPELHEMPHDVPSRRFLGALGRSIFSTVTIGSVAIGVFALLRGYYQWAQIKVIVSQNLPLLGSIFTGVFVWNCWVTFGRKAAPRP